jgi:hypothetical protein
VDLVSHPYPFDASFERDVVALMVTSDTFFNRVGMHLDPARLRDENGRLLAAAARVLYEQVGKAPGSLSVILQSLRVQHERGKLTGAKMAACADYICDALDAGLPEVDVAVHHVAEVLRRDGQQAVLDRAFTTYAERGSMLDIAREFEEVESIGRSDASYGVGLEGFAAELDSIGTIERLPTGFRELDVEMGGGLARGEFAFWLAGTKVGKSMALVQNAAIGLYRGMHVAVATLELDVVKWRARVLGTVTGTPYQDIIKHGSQSVAFERYAEIKDDPDFGLGRLSAHKFGGHQTTLPEVLDWVKREEDRYGQQVELLVIDYADKLVGKDTRDGDYTQMRDVYEGIRLWANDTSAWSWSASQAQRIAMGEMPTINSVADSQHKVRVTDLMVGLTRNPDEENKVRAKILALRNGSGDGSEAGPLPNGFEYGCFVRNVAFGVEENEALQQGDDDNDGLGIFA